jgi:hypothetical protein
MSGCMLDAAQHPADHRQTNFSVALAGLKNSIPRYVGLRPTLRPGHPFGVKGKYLRSSAHSEPCKGERLSR